MTTEINRYDLSKEKVTCGEAFTIGLTAVFACQKDNRIELWTAGDCTLRVGGQSGEITIPVDGPGFDQNLAASLDCPKGTEAVIRIYARATDCNGGSHRRWRPLGVRCP